MMTSWRLAGREVKRSIAACLAATLSVSGCSKVDQDADRCSPVPRWDQLVEQHTSPTQGNVPKAVMAKWCVQRAAYLLAKSNEPTAHVQQAALALCEREVGEAGRAYLPEVQLSDDQAASYAAGVREDLSGFSFAAVVEARAYQCWLAVGDDAPVADYMRFSRPRE